MLKDAIRFHDFSWQPNLMTMDMNVLPVGSFVGHAIIMHKELKRMLAMKPHNLSMNHCDSLYFLFLLFYRFSCGNCHVDLLLNLKECRCCHEIPDCLIEMNN